MANDQPTNNNREVQACSVIDLAAHALAQQHSARGTLSEQADRGRDCQPIPRFDSEGAMLAAQEKMQAAGLPGLNAFVLTGKGTASSYVEDSIHALEQAMGHNGGDLNYIWFNDDNGNAQVFITGTKPPASSAEAVPAKTNDSPKGACVDLGDSVDSNLNQSLRLPLGTTEREAIRVEKERKHQAELVKIGLAPYLTQDQADQIGKDRSAQIAALRQALSDDPAAQSSFNDQVAAITIGLPANSDRATIDAMKAKYVEEAKAINLGLTEYASAADIKNAEDEVNHSVNGKINDMELLPAGTTNAQRDQIFEQRSRQSNLAAAGIDPTLSSDAVRAILNQRASQESQISGLLSDEIVAPAGGDRAESEQRKAALNLEMSAVQIGLPDSATAEEVSAAQEKYGQQSLAVLMGLPINTSKADIDAARERSEAIEMQDVPASLCSIVQHNAGGDN